MEFLVSWNSTQKKKNKRNAKSCKIQLKWNHTKAETKRNESRPTQKEMDDWNGGGRILLRPTPAMYFLMRGMVDVWRLD